MLLMFLIAFSLPSCSADVTASFENLEIDPNCHRDLLTDIRIDYGLKISGQTQVPSKAFRVRLKEFIGFEDVCLVGPSGITICFTTQKYKSVWGGDWISDSHEFDPSDYDPGPIVIIHQVCNPQPCVHFKLEIVEVDVVTAPGVPPAFKNEKVVHQYLFEMCCDPGPDGPIITELTEDQIGFSG